MKVLQLINRQRQLVAKVIWESPSQVEINFSKNTINTSTITSELSNLLDECKLNGIPSRIGEKIEDESGHTIFRERGVLVRLDEEEFLSALGDLINRLSFGENKERVFAIIQK